MTAPKPREATPEEALVEAARAGDLAAFEALVACHEGGARAAAMAATGDPEAARDVVQEAFLDAYRLLHQLREPRAFAGWLRRIVRKHADRARRRQREIVSADADAAPAPASGPGPLLDRARLATRVRVALGALPPDQREATRLFYLGDRTAAEIAADLELPLTTIKKRLHSARHRLRKEFEMDPELRREFTRPDLPSEVRFFLAVRAGRTDEVAALLDTEPGLVAARESWTREEALRDGLPYADHATALARAAAQGDVALLELLLERGAAVDSACDCIAGETPLFNAVGAGETGLVTRLLESGADPDRAAGAGTTPLHLAVHAGHPECAELLLAHGARVDALDSGGRTAADWARDPAWPDSGPTSRFAVLGRVLAPDGTPLDGGPDVDWRGTGTSRAPADAKPAQPGHLLTGVKAIDLFCPLPRGGNVEVRGSGGLGIVVALGELTLRLARSGGVTVWCAFERRGDEGRALRAGLRELGVDRKCALVLAEKRHGEDSHDHALHTAFEIADGVAATGAPARVILMADETRDEVVARALAGRPAGVALFVVRARMAVPAVGLAPFAPPWDARLLFDPSLAARHFYPAIDPVRSESRLLRDDVVGEQHVSVSARVRALLAGDGPRAERIRVYLTQPFHTTTAFTAKPGVHVTPSELLRDLEGML